MAKPSESVELADKIARLVEERGWNQEDFARIAGLNRHTVRTILQSGQRKMRNATVQSCARALGITVSELRVLTLDRLLPKMRGQAAARDNQPLLQLVAQANHPELVAWLERNQERVRQFTPSDIDELLALQSEPGPLDAIGVERVIEVMERRRELIQRVRTIAGTEYLPLLEQVVDLIHQRIGQSNP